MWYAMIVAALCADHDALAMMHAMKLEVYDFRDASDMSMKMTEGCEQVLRLMTDDDNIYNERGLVITTACRHSTPKVTYSAAEVWQAEIRKEAVMMGKDAFGMLWSLLPVPGRMNRTELTNARKQQFLCDSVKWSSNVMVYVDMVAALASLEVNSKALANVRATARRGWRLHTVWVAMAISVHYFHPQRLIFLATFSFASLTVAWTALYVHVVYVGAHLWTLNIGRICRLFLVMSDSAIHSMAWWGYYSALAVVNGLALYLGTLGTLWGRVCFLSITLSSILPGFICFVWAKRSDDADGSVRYNG